MIFSNNSQSDSSDNDNPRSVNSVTILLGDVSSTSYEENCSVDDEDQNEVMLHPSINIVSIYDRIVEAYKFKCIFLNDKLKSIDQRNFEIKEFLKEKIYQSKIDMRMLIKNYSNRKRVVNIPRKTIQINNSSLFDYHIYDNDFEELRTTGIKSSKGHRTLCTKQKSYSENEFLFRVKI